MKCPKCGHENSDIRLFCANCGEELPEENEIFSVREPLDNEETIRVPVPMEAELESEFSVSEDTIVVVVDENISADDEPTIMPAQEFFVDPWPGEETVDERRAPAIIFDDAPVYDTEPTVQDNAFARPVREEAERRPVLNRREVPEGARAKTHIPKRDEHLDPDDFFAVRGQVLPEYDEEIERPAKRKRRVNEFEDSAPQSFAVRHMRSIVAIVLLAVTAIIVTVWANTDSAQRALAQIDVAWKSEAYAELGEEARLKGDLSAAGYYYGKALEREETNYIYAYNAAYAYIEGGYTQNAVSAIRDCIALRPEDPELYVMLMELQSGYDNMSEDDRKLVEQGYALTKDERLNIK